jgi:hypothetical protein
VHGIALIESLPALHELAYISAYHAFTVAIHLQHHPLLQSLFSQLYQVIVLIKGGVIKAYTRVKIVLPLLSTLLLFS